MGNMKNGITHHNLGYDITQLSKEQFNKMTEVYVCSSFACNLSCPHCTLKNLQFDMKLENIIKTMEIINDNAGDNLHYDMFGGEVLLLSKTIFDTLLNIASKRRYIISTNLLPLQEFHLKWFKSADCINVSWNPKRFNSDQYTKWLSLLNELTSNNINTNAMVTLTKDLIDEYTPQKFHDLYLKCWKVNTIDLEYFIGEDDKNSDEIDEWLCKLYSIWDVPTKFNIVENIKRAIKNNTVYKNCENNYTILPSGNIHNGCPYYEEDVVKTNCFLCEYYTFCNGGCRLETKCTFPKKLYEIIKKEI